jgi:hypothetical protein
MRDGRFLLCAGLCVASLAGPASQVAAAEKAAQPAVVAARQALVGVWKLNAQLSDDPRAKMRVGR